MPESVAHRLDACIAERRAAVKRHRSLVEYEVAMRHIAERGSELVLVIDTETNGLRGSVVEIGWILADSGGSELVVRGCVWPPTEGFVDRGAQAVHRIPDVEMLSAPDPTPELLRLFELFGAARAYGVRVVAHNAKFDTERIAKTAAAHDICVATRPVAFCTMVQSKWRCRALDRRGRLKNPSNLELFRATHGDGVTLPGANLHRAVDDARVTLASYVAGGRLGWW